MSADNQQERLDVKQQLKSSETICQISEKIKI